MADIFLSYATEDRATASQVACRLEARGFTVWWDRKIPAGMTWRQVIENALNDMGCMVVLWSQNSIASAWVSEEAEEGRTRARLVPALLEPVAPPLGFRGIQAADLVGWDGSPDAPGFRHLVAGVEALLGPRCATPPPPAGPTSALPAAGRTQRPLLLASAGLLVVLAVTGALVWQRHGAGETTPARTGTPPGITQAAPPPGSPSSPPAAVTAMPAPLSGISPSRPDAPAPTPGTDKVANASATSPARAVPPPARATAQPVRPARCRDLLERQGLGDPLTADDRAYFQKECRP